jgi:hypothetical protein
VFSLMFAKGRPSPFRGEGGKVWNRRFSATQPSRWEWLLMPLKRPFLSRQGSISSCGKRPLDRAMRFLSQRHWVIAEVAPLTGQSRPAW